KIITISFYSQQPPTTDIYILSLHDALPIYRIQIFDQDGKFLTAWTQFSRPSGIWIDAKDTIYVADSESESVSKNHDGWKRGIRIDRKSTRLNSSHVAISYAVFCLKKKKL